MILDTLCFQTCLYTVLSDGAPEYFVGGSSECKIKCLSAFIIVQSHSSRVPDEEL